MVPGAGAAGTLADTGAELHPVTTATTVKYGDNGPVVVDGPFNEAKEIIGGFTVLDVADMDAAIAITKSWPSSSCPGSRSRSGRWSRTTRQFE